MTMNACQEKSALKQLIDSYQKGLEDTIKSAESNSIVADHIQRGKCQAEKLAIDSRDLVKKTYQKYESLKLTMAKFGKNAEELQTDICEVNDNLKAELDNKLTTTITALKDLNKQIKVVNTAMCAVENETSDNCNSKQLQILKNIEKLNAKDSNCWDDEPVDNNGEPINLEKTGYEDWLKKLCDHTDTLTFDINHIMEVSIHAASINARLNFTSLKAAGSALKESAVGLGGNAQACFTGLEKEFKEICAALVTAKTENSSATFAESATYTKLKGLKNFKEHIDQLGEDCGDWNSIETKIKKITSCYVPEEE